jgi:hypothetical protein
MIMDNKGPSRIGSILLEKGMITKEQLDTAIQLQIKRRSSGQDESRSSALGEILIELGFIDRLQLNRSLNWQKLLRKVALVMSLCAPLMAVMPTSATAATTSSSSSSSIAKTAVNPFPVTIQAENFTSMFGVQNEITKDIGGGLNTGYLHAGDWMSFSGTTVNVPVAGQYKVTFRVASAGGGSTFSFAEADNSVVYDTIVVPKTGGDQVWTDVTRTITLTAGAHSFRVNILTRTTAFNLNWFSLEPVSSLPITIQAENYSAMFGVQGETTTDVGGGLNLGYMHPGDWMSYANTKIYIPKTGSYKVTYRVASPGGGGSFSLLEADGSLKHDTVLIGNTGGVQKWVDVERVINLTAGFHSFKINVDVRGLGFNLNWFKISDISNTSSSSSSLSNATSSAASSAATTSVKASSSSSAPSSASATSSSASSIGKISKVNGSAALSWLIPNQRENGDFLDVIELGGYELRYRKDTDTAFTYVTINDAWQNFYNFSGISGNYIFQISAFDKNGMYSGFVDLVSR